MSSTVYITNDIETAGPDVGVHSVLSWGACVVTPEVYSADELKERGLVFYTELQPTSSAYVLDAMRVGAVGLDAIHNDVRRGDAVYDVRHARFSPRLVLARLGHAGETMEHACLRFCDWLDGVCGGASVVPVFDTVCFDSVFIKWMFATADVPCPFGWGGLDLDSMYRGYARSRSATLRQLGLEDTRPTAHRAEDDAIFLAEIARELMFNRMKA